MKKGLSPWTVCAAALAASVLPDDVVAVDPANFQAGPVYIAPTLDLRGGYVDNLLRSSEDELSTWMSELTPRIQAWLQDGVNSYSLKYELVDYRYASSHEDDYTDHRANLDLHHEFNSKNVINVFGEYYDGHEQRGTGFTDGVGDIIPTPVEYERGSIGGDYSYGNRASKGRFKLEAKRDEYEYQNYRRTTQFRDRDQDTLSGTFFWKIGAKTDALIQLRSINNDYVDTAPDLIYGGSFDSEEYNYLVGLSWDPTAKVSGSVKVGAYEREYDTVLRGDDDGFHWEVDLTYKPRSYSRIDFGTRRFTTETNGFADSINTEEYELSWGHDWSDRSSTHLGVRARDEKYAGTNRDDDRLDWDASYVFAARRWLDLEAGYRREDRDSSNKAFEYTRNLYFIEARLSL